MRNGIFASRPGRASSFLALLAVAALVTASAEKYFCGGRELTAAETAEVTRVIEVLRKALSAAPAGWSIQSDDAGVDCFGFSKPGPAPIFYMRSYLHIADGLLAAGAADDGAMLYRWSFASTPE